MHESMRSGLLAGLIAAVIWMLISTAVDLGRAPVIAGGLACLIGTWMITAAVVTVKRRARAGG